MTEKKLTADSFLKLIQRQELPNPRPTIEIPSPQPRKEIESECPNERIIKLSAKPSKKAKQATCRHIQRLQDARRQKQKGKELPKVVDASILHSKHNIVPKVDLSDHEEEKKICTISRPRMTKFWAKRLQIKEKKDKALLQRQKQKIQGHIREMEEFLGNVSEPEIFDGKEIIPGAPRTPKPYLNIPQPETLQKDERVDQLGNLKKGEKDIQPLEERNDLNNQENHLQKEVQTILGSKDITPQKREPLAELPISKGDQFDVNIPESPKIDEADYYPDTLSQMNLSLPFESQQENVQAKADALTLADVKKQIFSMADDMTSYYIPIEDREQLLFPKQSKIKASPVKRRFDVNFEFHLKAVYDHRRQRMTELWRIQEKFKHNYFSHRNLLFRQELKIRALIHKETEASIKLNLHLKNKKSKIAIRSSSSSYNLTLYQRQLSEIHAKYFILKLQYLSQAKKRRYDLISKMQDENYEFLVRRIIYVWLQVCKANRGKNARKFFLKKLQINFRVKSLFNRWKLQAEMKRLIRESEEDAEIYYYKLLMRKGFNTWTRRTMERRISDLSNAIAKSYREKSILATYFIEWRKYAKKNAFLKRKLLGLAYNQSSFEESEMDDLGKLHIYTMRMKMIASLKDEIIYEYRKQRRQYEKFINRDQYICFVKEPVKPDISTSNKRTLERYRSLLMRKRKESLTFNSLMRSDMMSPRILPKKDEATSPRILPKKKFDFENEEVSTNKVNFQPEQVSEKFKPFDQIDSTPVERESFSKQIDDLLKSDENKPESDENKSENTKPSASTIPKEMQKTGEIASTMQILNQVCSETLSGNLNNSNSSNDSSIDASNALSRKIIQSTHHSVKYVASEVHRVRSLRKYFTEWRIQLKLRTMQKSADNFRNFRLKRIVLKTLKTNLVKIGSRRRNFHVQRSIRLKTTIFRKWYIRTVERKMEMERRADIFHRKLMIKRSLVNLQKRLDKIRLLRQLSEKVSERKNYHIKKHYLKAWMITLIRNRKRERILGNREFKVIQFIKKRRFLMWKKRTEQRLLLRRVFSQSMARYALQEKEYGCKRILLLWKRWARQKRKERKRSMRFRIANQWLRKRNLQKFFKIWNQKTKNYIQADAFYSERLLERVKLLFQKWYSRAVKSTTVPYDHYEKKLKVRMFDQWKQEFFLRKIREVFLKRKYIRLLKRHCFEERENRIRQQHENIQEQMDKAEKLNLETLRQAQQETKQRLTADKSTSPIDTSIFRITKEIPKTSPNLRSDRSSNQLNESEIIPQTMEDKLLSQSLLSDHSRSHASREMSTQSQTVGSNANIPTYKNSSNATDEDRIQTRNWTDEERERYLAKTMEYENIANKSTVQAKKAIMQERADEFYNQKLQNNRSTAVSTFRIETELEHLPGYFLPTYRLLSWRQMKDSFHKWKLYTRSRNIKRFLLQKAAQRYYLRLKFKMFQQWRRKLKFKSYIEGNVTPLSQSSWSPGTELLSLHRR